MRHFKFAEQWNKLWKKHKLPKRIRAASSDFNLKKPKQKTTKKHYFLTGNAWDCSDDDLLTSARPTIRPMAVSACILTKLTADVRKVVQRRALNHTWMAQVTVIQSTDLKWRHFAFYWGGRAGIAGLGSINVNLLRIWQHWACLLYFQWQFKASLVH